MLYTALCNFVKIGLKLHWTTRIEAGPPNFQNWWSCCPLHRKLNFEACHSVTGQLLDVAQSTSRQGGGGSWAEILVASKGVGEVRPITASNGVELWVWVIVSRSVHTMKFASVIITPSEPQTSWSSMVWVLRIEVVGVALLDCLVKHYWHAKVCSCLFEDICIYIISLSSQF